MVSRFNVRDLIKTIWLTRPDLRELCRDDKDRFEHWLLLNGENEYAALNGMWNGANHESLYTLADAHLPSTAPGLTKFMYFLWESRADLRKVFDLRDQDQQQEFVWWYFRHGVSEASLERYVTEEQRNWLNDADPQFPAGGPISITRLMGKVWQERSDLQDAFDLSNVSMHEEFLGWYFTYGLRDLKIATYMTTEQAKWLTQKRQHRNLPNILFHIWQTEAELQKRFPNPTEALFKKYFQLNGVSRYPAIERLHALNNSSPASSIRPRVSNSPSKHGVNLIGYAYGQFGIGEDVRMASLAMESAGIPFSIYNIKPGNEVRQEDDSVARFVSEQHPYDTNIFCMTGMETGRLAAIVGSDLFEGKRCIGYWPWELPDWPAEWQHAYNLVDEVWASSEFTETSYKKSSTKPVYRVPMAVSVKATEGLTRSDFGLPIDRFLFVFSFDFLSSMARKNPRACIDAFFKAFPRGSEPVGIVVKAMRASASNRQWKELVEDARSDARISIVNETLSRGAVLDLYRCCDCYVSLHRSEGFGRGIAEAMMLGKPVVVTAFSGNMDFTTPETAGLVPYKLIPVLDNDYPFGRGQTWAEPNIDEAAKQMMRVFEDRKWRRSIAKRGQGLLDQTYSVDMIGNQYRKIWDNV